MQTIILLTHVISAVLLVVAILAQEKGSGMGSAIAGSAGGGFVATQRGAAKVLHYASIVLSVIFVSSALSIILV
jgi:protein translocase SecG subunit